MNGHVILISGLWSKYFPTNGAQERRCLFVGGLAYHIRGSYRILNASFAFVHQANVRVQSLHALTPLQAPTTPHWFDILLVCNAMHLLHMRNEVIIRSQIDDALIAMQIETVWRFETRCIVDFRMFVHFDGAPKQAVTFHTFYRGIFVVRLDDTFVDGSDVPA